MASSEPSLSEISNFDKDANLVKGSAAVPIDLSSGLKGVWDLAHEKAQYDWAKYQNHLKQVSDYAAGHQLDYAGVRSTDIPLISKMANEYYQDIARDPKKLSQIGNDPKWNEIQAKVGQSKQLNSYADKQREFLDKNPHLWTDENKRRYQSFMEGSIDQKPSDFQLDMPKTIDMQGLASKVLTTVERGGIGKAKQYDPMGERVMEEVTLPSGQKESIYSGLIRSKKGGIEFGKDDYMNIGNALYSSGQPTGQGSKDSIPEAATYMYSQLKDEEKQSYIKKDPKNPQKAYFMDEWEKMYRKEGGKEDIKDEVDQSYKRDTELMLADKRQRQAVYLKNLEFGHSDKEKNEAAKGLINIAKDVLTNVDKNSNPISVEGGEAEPVLSVTKAMNKFFLKTIEEKVKDKTDKVSVIKTTIEPDKYTRTKNGEIRPLYFSRYTQDDLDEWGKNNPDKGEAPFKVGDVKKQGNTKLFTSGEPVTTSDLMTNIVKETGNGSSKNNLDVLKQAQDILNKEGGINKVITKKVINRSDIPAKAKAANYSVKEYEALLKKNGVEIN